MRRVHPQRSKAPATPRREAFAASDTSQGYRNKPWTTVSDIHRQSQSQNQSQNRSNKAEHKDINGSGSSLGDSVDLSLPFSFKPPTMSHQEKPGYTKRQMNFDDDEDLESPRGDSNNDFEVTNTTKSRRLEHQATLGTSQRHQFPVDDGSNNQTMQISDQLGSKRSRDQALTEVAHALDDPWSPSPDSLDLDFSRIGTASPSEGSPILCNTKEELTAPSVTSDMQHALHEIDELLMEDSAPMSPTPEPRAVIIDDCFNDWKHSQETFALKSGPPSELGSATEDRCQSTDTELKMDVGHNSSVGMQGNTLDESPEVGREQLKTRLKSGPILPSPDANREQDQSQTQPAPVFDIPASITEFTSQLDGKLERVLTLQIYRRGWWRSLDAYTYIA
ncbi:hypothetical protein EDD21DRAFT_381723 [Dissophora ornata]|nr:hypothetical protein EDD21DRAFT_381723 [Dissophora ornata]